MTSPLSSFSPPATLFSCSSVYKKSGPIWLKYMVGYAEKMTFHIGKHFQKLLWTLHKRVSQMKPASLLIPAHHNLSPTPFKAQSQGFIWVFAMFSLAYAQGDRQQQNWQDIYRKTGQSQRVEIWNVSGTQPCLGEFFRGNKHNAKAIEKNDYWTCPEGL